MSNIEVSPYHAHVAVLLSTYDGAQYLEEQLDSLLAQEYKNFTVFIRDDGSSDRTHEILVKYSERDSRFVIIPSEGNLGVIGSFLHLCSLVEADYYFFCDQDDVWFPEKIKETLEMFEGKDNNLPLLVHTDLVITDSALNLINPSFYAYTGTPIPDKQNAEMILLQNYIVGCTISINKTLRDKVVTAGYDTKRMYMHDWWAALIATYYGEVITLRKSTINYRQHGHNQCGARERNKLKLFIELLNNSVFKRFSANRNKIYTQVQYFQSVYHSGFHSFSTKNMDAIIEFKQSHIVKRLWILIRGKFPTSTTLRKLFDLFFIHRN